MNLTHAIPWRLLPVITPAGHRGFLLVQPFRGGALIMPGERVW